MSLCDSFCSDYSCLNRTGSGYCPLTACTKQKNITIQAQTRGDVIRSYSDEELADFFMEREEQGRLHGVLSKACWLDWLTQEVDDAEKA